MQYDKTLLNELLENLQKLDKDEYFNHLSKIFAVCKKREVIPIFAVSVEKRGLGIINFLEMGDEDLKLIMLLLIMQGRPPIHEKLK